ncbi:PTS sugar transporter subunit IIA [Staphylococcus aureus]|nr:PTS sugar transporter subunit IIA [Staphylococcus aureus]UXT29978.1 PTS sugar transporter subunit IIA [Staphylococcus aureus]UXU14934.1 PTS sugar transporter subunit IIA [Staphylococcus aureus]
MSELFSNDNIFLNVNVNSQNEAIEKAGKALVDSGAVTDAYIQAMKDREQVVSTFMGNGLAITFSEEENVDRIVQAKSAEEIKQVFEEADA